MVRLRPLLRRAIDPRLALLHVLRHRQERQVQQVDYSDEQLAKILIDAARRTRQAPPEAADLQRAVHFWRLAHAKASKARPATPKRP